MNLFFRLFRFTLLITISAGVQSGCEKHDSPARPLSKHEATPEATLSLNEGKKWQVDEHTRKSVLQMKRLVENTAPDELGKSMAGEISNLFKGCTMQGPAHDQLHLFLTDLLGNVNGLYSSTTPDERSVEIRAIRKSLKRFDSFFE